MKKINFLSSDEVAFSLKNGPVSAVKKIPKWYKDMNRLAYPDQKNLILEDGGFNSTLKTCMPFFDSLSLGYVYQLSTDILAVSPNQYDGKRIIWDVEDQIIDIHNKSQAPNIHDQSIFEDYPFKFISKWVIQTPPGYSILITHPLNRVDLPFYTLSGVVDTDSYFNEIHFPFLLKKDFFGKIDRGTPIAQIIPFKRENWQSNTEESDVSRPIKYELKSIIGNSYKKQWWKKKKFY